MSEIGQDKKDISAIHVIAGVYAEHGGPSYSVPRLCEALVCQGTAVSLFSVAEPGGRQRDVEESGYRDRRFAWDYANLPVLKGLRKSRGLTRALREALRSIKLWAPYSGENRASRRRALISEVLSGRRSFQRAGQSVRATCCGRNQALRI